MAAPKIHRISNLGRCGNIPLCNMNVKVAADRITSDNDAVTCGSCHRSMWRSWGMEPPPTLSRNLGGRKQDTMTKKKKMTTPQKRKVWNEITPNALVDITFADISKFHIDYNGDLTMDVSAESLPREILASIAKGTPVQFEADSDWDPEGGEEGLHYENCEYVFRMADPCIFAIKITQQGKRRSRVYLGSLNETMVLEEGNANIDIGCQSLSRADAEAAAIAIFEWLGYEVSQ